MCEEMLGSPCHKITYSAWHWEPGGSARAHDPAEKLQERLCLRVFLVAALNSEVFLQTNEQLLMRGRQMWRDKRLR